MNVTKPNPVPQIGDHWQRLEDGRIFQIDRIVGGDYAGGIYLEEERKVEDPADPKKTKIVKIRQCDGGVLFRSLANQDRFRLVARH